MTEKKLKIMVVLFTLQMGGAERVAISYCNWLVENTNNDVYLLYFNEKKDIYEINKKVKMKKIDIEKKSKLKVAYNKYNSLKKVMKDIKPNIIFTMFFKSSIYMLLTKPRESILISSERAHIKKRKMIAQKLSKYVSIKCDGFIFQTERIKKLYPKKTRKKSIVIQNAVSNYLSINKMVEKENTITAMGRLNHQKGFDVLIQAFKKFNDEIKGYKLIILGEGEERTNLEKLIENLNLKDNVFLVGNKKNALEYIAKSKLFILSSRYEGMPNALLEALGTGTACISTDCEFGPDEIIDNYHNGILVNIDDIDMLTDKIKEVLMNKELRLKLEKNAVEILNTNSKEEIYRKYYNYMKDIYTNKKNQKSILKKIVKKLLRSKIANILSDKTYLKIKFWIKTDYKLNLKNPQTFNEKLQWLKINDRNPLYTKMVDKYEAKDYIKDIIGKEYIIPTIDIYDNFDEINFEKLPDKFVIKVTHDSGGVIVCDDKNKFNKEKAKIIINNSLKNNYYYQGREWPYKNVKPRIIIEKYLECDDLVEYKFFCFNGNPEYLYVVKGKAHTSLREGTFYNIDLSKSGVSRSDIPEIEEKIEKPKNYDKMVEFAKILSRNVDFLRVDFYNINGNIYCGELTFYPASGCIPFSSFEIDKKLGKKLKLTGGKNEK